MESPWRAVDGRGETWTWAPGVRSLWYRSSLAGVDSTAAREWPFTGIFPSGYTRSAAETRGTKPTARTAARLACKKTRDTVLRLTADSSERVKAHDATDEVHPPG